MTRRHRYAHLNESRTLVFDSREGALSGRTPYGLVLMLWNVSSAMPSTLYGGRRAKAQAYGQSFQCRVICPDGTMWSGRSTRGGLSITLHEVSPTGKTAEAMRRQYPQLFPKAG